MLVARLWLARALQIFQPALVQQHALNRGCQQSRGRIQLYYPCITISLR